MMTALHRHRLGFSLVEIMIVVAIIALLAALAVPNFLRARKRTHATRILEDLRVLDYAMDRWALERNKSAGDEATFSDLRPYIKTGTPLHVQGANVFGHPYGPFLVDLSPKVPDATFDALSDVAPAEFWSPYR